MLLLEVPENALTLCESEHPDRDTSLILEHLIRSKRHDRTLPAITATNKNNKLVVTRGHKYLLVARALAHATVRVVVEGAPSGFDPANVHPEVRALDWPSLRAEEALDPYPKGWHTFFFLGVLSSEAKRAFALAVTEVFGSPDIEIFHDDTGPAAEFEARIRPEDISWTRRHLETFQRFDRDWTPIASYLGSRFPGVRETPGFSSASERE